MIEVAKDAKRINQILNHPGVYSWISDDDNIDMTETLKKLGVVGLLGDYGCVIFHPIQLGIYEFHIAVLPDHQGEYVSRFFREVCDWIFTRTNAVEIITRCPENNRPAKMACSREGMDHIFHTRPLFLSGGKLFPYKVYGMTVQKWATLSESLVDQGKLFHQLLEDEYTKIGGDILEKHYANHFEDNTHDRYVGGAFMMVKAGFPQKAVSFYNRWAIPSDYQAISVVSLEPLVIDLVMSKIRFNKSGFEVIQ